MRDCEMKRNMTNTGLEKHQSNSEQESLIVLLHGTSGQSEDWSQVVEQLTRHRPVIRLNYAEPVAGTDSANGPRVSDFADRVVATAGAGGTHRFDLIGYSLACLIHIFEDNKGLLCYKHVVKTMFAATKEASECLKIAQHSGCCSQEFFASLPWPSSISARGVPTAARCPGRRLIDVMHWRRDWPPAFQSAGKPPELSNGY